MPAAEIKDFIEQIRASRAGRGKVVHVRHFPAVRGGFSAPAAPFPPGIRRLLEERGTGRLYSHQAEALDAARAGKNVLISTHTSSGKTLVYNLLVLEGLLEKPERRALYVYPAKALARDQLKTAGELAGALDSGIMAGVYDGDTPTGERAAMKRSPPEMLFTNPDMLHSGILAYHGSWAEFFKNLRYVVLDELHAYRGVFGCHVASVIRRLRRIAAFYGSEPQFVGSSATMANGAEFTSRLTGLDFTIISESGAPRGERYFMFWDPGESSPYTDASHLLEAALKNSLKTIVFTKSRKITELIYRWTLDRNPSFEGRISAYRAGYLPEERREIEKQLFGDGLDAVIATSALELGIDVGGLDCCILAGYPGSVISSWQRAGRAGRGDRPSLIVMAALPDALDKYFMRNPGKFFESGFESVIIDEKNEPVLREHLACAASELPLSGADEKFFAGFTGLLAEPPPGGRLIPGECGKTWFCPVKYPHRNLSIRSIGENWTIADAGTGKVMGDISSARVFSECHPGAVYLHRASDYEVERLDLQARAVYARKASVDYYTQTTCSETVEIVETLKTRKAGPFLASAGKVRVNSQVVSWEKRRAGDGALIGEYKLDLPVQSFETSAMWLELHRGASRVANLQGGLHAVEHAAIALFPLIALCDRWDVGGVSSLFHPQCGGPVIFLHDACPGGAGLSEKAYQEAGELLRCSLRLISECECSAGCPSCIQSPKCGSRNEPLDKECAVKILKGDVPAGRVEKNPPRASFIAAGPGPRGKQRREPFFFDVETQRSAEEVGGWGNKRLMRVSVAVSYDEKESAYEVYREPGIGRLIDKIFGAELVVGFNVKSFDMEVLRYYSERDFSGLEILDILEDVRRSIGRRISLGDLASETLGEKKTGSGLDALEWFRNNEIAKLVEYCAKDVEITRNLFYFGRENGHLLFRHGKFGRMRIPVDW